MRALTGQTRGISVSGRPDKYLPSFLWIWVLLTQMCQRCARPVPIEWRRVVFRKVHCSFDTGDEVEGDREWHQFRLTPIKAAQLCYLCIDSVNGLTDSISAS